MQSKPSKILARTERRQVGKLTSSERGQTVTTEICLSVTGNFIPPLFILPRVRMKMELMNGAPPGSIYACHKSGWMQMDIFTTWFKHFIRSSGASKDNPVLLILDGHATHAKNLDVIDTARENGVVMLCLPPHCSHRMQPLDVNFMKPISTYYDQELEKWLRNNQGRVVTTFQVAELFGHAYMKAATAQIAASGFHKTGIHPTKRDIFLPHEFEAAEATDRPIKEGENVQNVEAGTVEDNQSVKDLHAVVSSGENTGAIVNENIAGTASDRHAKEPEEADETDPSGTSDDAVPSTSGYVSPFEISPPPKATTRNNKKPNATRGKTVVLTRSPYKQELIAAKQGKAEKTQGHSGKRSKPSTRDQQKTTTAKKAKRAEPVPETDSSSAEIDDDAECIYCGELWSKSNEAMIQCTSCEEWAHLACAGKEYHDVRFVCDFCD